MNWSKDYFRLKYFYIHFHKICGHWTCHGTDFSEDVQNANFNSSPASCCDIILGFPEWDTEALNSFLSGTCRFLTGFYLKRTSVMKELNLECDYCNYNFFNQKLYLFAVNLYFIAQLESLIPSLPIVFIWCIIGILSSLELLGIFFCVQLKHVSSMLHLFLFPFETEKLVVSE